MKLISWPRTNRQKFAVLAGLLAAVMPVHAEQPKATFTAQTLIRPGKPWPDTNGVHINKPEDPVNAGYIWLPIEFEDEQPIIHWRDQWDHSVFSKP
jgi:hypothetical protein